MGIQIFYLCGYGRGITQEYCIYVAVVQILLALFTVPLNYNFIFAVVPCSILHVNCQSLPWNLYFTRHDVALPQVVFTRDVEFTCDGNMTSSRDAVVLTKLSNWQDSSCL